MDYSKLANPVQSVALVDPATSVRYEERGPVVSLAAKTARAPKMVRELRSLVDGVETVAPSQTL